MSRFLAPADVAEELGLDTPAVLRFIASGELVAHNMAAPGSRVNRWRIDPEDLRAFLLRRRSQAPTKQQRKPRRKPAAEVAFY